MKKKEIKVVTLLESELLTALGSIKALFNLEYDDDSFKMEDWTLSIEEVIHNLEKKMGKIPYVEISEL